MRTWTSDRIDQAVKKLERGKSLRQTAKEMGLSHQNLRIALIRNNAMPNLPHLIPNYLKASIK